MAKDLDKELARIAERHHGAFAAHHLDELKVSREARAVRVEAGRWLPVHDGVFRMAGSPVTWQFDAHGRVLGRRTSGVGVASIGRCALVAAVRPDRHHRADLSTVATGAP